MHTDNIVRRGESVKHDTVFVILKPLDNNGFEEHGEREWPRDTQSRGQENQPLSTWQPAARWE